jgi:hypothetical protein
LQGAPISIRLHALPIIRRIVMKRGTATVSPDELKKAIRQNSTL